MSGAVLLTLSAGNLEELSTEAARLGGQLADNPDVRLTSLAATLTKRPALSARLAMVASDTGEATAALLERSPVRRGIAGPADRPVVFLLPGVGDHFRGLAGGLYRCEPVFRAEFDACAAAIGEELDIDLRELVNAVEPERPGPVRRPFIQPRAADPELSRPTVAQPLVYAVEYALARLLVHYGLRPTALLGYSVGEYVAATLARVIHPTDAARLIARRAKLIEGTEPGAMTSVLLGVNDLEAYLIGSRADDLVVSAIDGEWLCVVSGRVAAVERLEATLAADAVASRRIPVRNAFHSPLLRPVEAEVAAAVGGFSLRAPGIPMLSNVTGTWLTARDAVDPAYWARHMCQPVRFADNLSAVLRLPSPLLVEVGPGRALTTLARQHPDWRAGTEEVTTLPGSGARGDDVTALLMALGTAWVAGLDVDRTAAALSR